MLNTSVSRILYGTVFLSALCLSSCTPKEPTAHLLPAPSEMNISEGIFKIDSANLFVLQNSDNIKYSIDPQSNIAKEGYRLTVNKEGVNLTASTEAGLFYGKQTLRQLLTPKGLPYVEIKDEPRLPYRGLHIDVSRHFFDKEEIMKIMNVMSYYKLNTLHLHLTDVTGWRLQIDKYPKLTSDGAFRPVQKWKDWWFDPNKKFVKEGTEGAYGGYYTKDDIREMLAYAAKRHINVIPEIEFPGHSWEVFEGYPELNCFGKKFVGEFCIGNPKTYEFMENVLSEVIELFPSKFIHIGGDEAGHGNWMNCPKCKALMKKEKMKSPKELQSYLIHHADSFITSKGRRLIGWDEILQGGLAPGAAVMSWQGVGGGLQAAKMGHDVVMTPYGYMYFDLYQGDPRYQPEAIGGFTPIKKVYSFDPVPQNLTPEEAKHIIGVQGNTWTEYIPTEEHLEYMMFPRALAVAEIGWTPQAKRNWKDFQPRMNAQIPVLQSMGLHPYTLSKDLEFHMNVDTINKAINVSFETEVFPAEIHYTMDGTTPTVSSPVYKDTLSIKDSATLVAGIFKEGKLAGNLFNKKIGYHLGIGKKIKFLSQLCGKYYAGGEKALIDGYFGGASYSDGRWQGYLEDTDCIIDLGETTDIHYISSRWMQLRAPGIFQPVNVEVLLSDDGENFKSIGVIENTLPMDYSKLTFIEYPFKGEWKTRYIRLKAKHSNGFTFADEIVIW